LFDTAELYGFGRSEKLIGEFSKGYPEEKIQVATKFAPFPTRTKPSDVVKACENSLTRLGRPIDLYQIHFPNAWSNEEYWDGLALAYERGLVKSVGVSNYGVDAVKACHDALAKRGIPLASNQIQLSLLYRYPLENGLMQACQDLGVKVLSYSPLALGMLTGKYTLEKPPQGPRKALFERLKSTPDYDNLLNTMKDVASGHGDPTLSQVALNWARAKNSIPIPGARTLSQVKQNYAALDWNLSSAEVAALDKAAEKVSTFTNPDIAPFPKQDIKTKLRMFDS
jgi:pyridoxine 4-dehydrogenase